MMRTTTWHGASSVVHYFEEGYSKEDYLTEERKITAIWRGKTAEMLGLEDQEVEKETLSALANNRHPETGERITVRDAANRKAGYEYCFSVPKSVSLVHAITGDNEILEAHKNAVHSAMTTGIEKDMQTQGTSDDGGKYYETTGNLIYAAFDHMTSRPVAKNKDGNTIYIPDPQIHTHSFVPNLTWSHEHHRYQALEEGNIRRLSPYYEARYHAALSKGLVDIGYKIECTKDRYEIAGITKATRDKFSNRTIEIEKLAAEKSITDPEAKSQLGAKTRVNKSKAIEDHKLHDLWKDRLTPKELQTIQEAKGKGDKSAEQISVEDAVDQGMDHFFERQSAVPEKRIAAHALTLGYGHLKSEDVHEELESRQNILRADKQTITYMTTKEMVSVEDRIIEYAAEGKGKELPLNTGYEIQNEILNEQQRNAITQILSSNDRVSILKGGAGVGKSSLLSEVKAGIEGAGKELMATAPSANASRNVLRSKGFENADTIASLLQNEELQKTLQNNVLLCDEAGMIGAKTLDQLFALAEKYNARLILSGDTRQHNSVEAGDGLRLLEENAGLTPATVQKVVRQKPEPYRKAIQKLAQGQTMEGFKALDKMEAIKEIPDQEERHKAIAKDYAVSIEQKRSALIVSPTHAEGEALTETVRQELKEREVITGDEKIFDTQRNLSLTDAQRRDKASYEEGLIVRFHQNQKGSFKAGKHYEVLSNENGKGIAVKSLETQETLSLPLDKTENFQLYQPTQIPIAKGDTIRITQNGKTMENTKIHNGQTYAIKGFTEQGDVMLSSGKTLSRDFRNFKHGLVETSHAAQGKDAQDVFIAQSAESFQASDEKQFYVSASRGSESVAIYTDNKDDLKNAINRGGDRMSARDIAKDQNFTDLQRKRRDYHLQQTQQSIEHDRTQTRSYDHEPTLSNYRHGPDRE